MWVKNVDFQQKSFLPVPPLSCGSNLSLFPGLLWRGLDLPALENPPEQANTVHEGEAKQEAGVTSDLRQHAARDLLVKDSGQPEEGVAEVVLRLLHSALHVNLHLKQNNFDKAQPHLASIPCLPPAASVFERESKVDLDM